jgi:hypothetical protein
MDNLQKLLDERWPMHETGHQDSFWKKSALRDAFTQGYNAAKEEAKQGCVNDDDLRAFHARMQENVAPLSGPLK